MRRIYVVGDANVDIIVPYPRFLNDERTLVNYPTPTLTGGGTAANTAVALAKLDQPVSFLGTIGDDQYGRYIIKDLQEQGVDTTDLIVEPRWNTVGVFAFVDERGERYLWGWPRVDQAFKHLEKDRIPFERLLQSDWIHSSGMSLVYDTSARTEIIEIFRRAHEQGISTSFDLNLRVDNGVLEPAYEQAVRDIIQYTTVLLGSGTDEFAYLGAGRDWRANARSLATDGRIVIVRNGAEGSYAITEEAEEYAPAFHVPVEDTVGAGDVYNAGFISAYMEGRSLRDCLIRGNAVSGYTVAHKGARSSPTQKELDDFLKQYSN